MTKEKNMQNICREEQYFSKHKGIALISLILIMIIIVLTIFLIYIFINEKSFNESNKISSEGQEVLEGIKTDNSVVEDEFKKYILGEDLNGRELTKIKELDNQIFGNNTNTTDNTQNLSIEVLKIIYNDDFSKMFIYVKYNNKAYKITCNSSNYTENLELIYTPQGNEGKVTEEGWIIIYDNGKTAEAVSPKVMGNLRLGYSAETASNEDNLEESIESYNNAIDIINNYCKELEGLPENIGVRSIGAKTDKTTNYLQESDITGYDTTTDKWFDKYNNIGKIEDENYEQDFVRMSYWGVSTADERYWIASRHVRYLSKQVEFCMRIIDSGGFLRSGSLWNVNSSNASGNSASCAVRPVITIENL